MAEKNGNTLYEHTRLDTMDMDQSKKSAFPAPDRLLALLNGEAVPEEPKEERLPAPEVMTKRQAAALLSVSLRTLDRLVARGEIPNIRLSRRCVRFPIVALKDWIESKTDCKEH